MTKFLLAFLATFLMFFGLTTAQDKWCGINKSELELVTKRLIQNKKAVAAGHILKSGAITYVPIKFHIMAQTNGSGGIDEIDCLGQITRLNEEYLDQEIQFFLAGNFNYVNNSAAFNDPRGTAGQFQLSSAKNQFFGRLNIFICLNAGDIANVGTSAGYYSPQFDWIVVRKNEVGLQKETLTHEVGHFFSLMHVFNGWDFGPYENGTHSNPAPVFSPGNVRTENMERDPLSTCYNCEFAGDMLCDTNPDYLLSQNFSTGNCNYNGNIMDPCGVLVEPPVDNVMSYFFGCDQQVFTPQQKEVMAADLASRRNLGTINSVFTPDSTEPVDGVAEAANPTDGGTINYNEEVTLQWTAVPNATRYVIDVDIFPEISAFKTRYFTSDTEILLGDINANDQYYWKVYAFNQYSTAAGWSPIYSFTSGDGMVAVEGISSVNNWNISPNPMTEGHELSIELNTTQSFEASISVLDIAGRQMMSQNQNIIEGQNNITLASNNLPNGIYIVKVNSEQGTLSKKLVITQ